MLLLKVINYASYVKAVNLYEITEENTYSISDNIFSPYVKPFFMFKTCPERNKFYTIFDNFFVKLKVIEVKKNHQNQIIKVKSNDQDIVYLLSTKDHLDLDIIDESMGRWFLNLFEKFLLENVGFSKKMDFENHHLNSQDFNSVIKNLNPDLIDVLTRNSHSKHLLIAFINLLQQNINNLRNTCRIDHQYHSSHKKNVDDNYENELVSSEKSNDKIKGYNNKPNNYYESHRYSTNYLLYLDVIEKLIKKLKVYANDKLPDILENIGLKKSLLVYLNVDIEDNNTTKKKYAQFVLHTGLISQNNIYQISNNDSLENHNNRSNKIKANQLNIQYNEQNIIDALNTSFLRSDHANSVKHDKPQDTKKQIIINKDEQPVEFMDIKSNQMISNSTPKKLPLKIDTDASFIYRKTDLLRDNNQNSNNKQIKPLNITNVTSEPKNYNIEYTKIANIKKHKTSRDFENTKANQDVNKTLLDQNIPTDVLNRKKLQKTNDYDKSKNKNDSNKNGLGLNQPLIFNPSDQGSKFFKEKHTKEQLNISSQNMQSNTSIPKGLDNHLTTPIKTKKIITKVFTKSHDKKLLNNFQRIKTTDQKINKIIGNVHSKDLRNQKLNKSKNKTNIDIQDISDELIEFHINNSSNSTLLPKTKIPKYRKSKTPDDSTGKSHIYRVENKGTLATNRNKKTLAKFSDSSLPSRIIAKNKTIETLAKSYINNKTPSKVNKNDNKLANHAKNKEYKNHDEIKTTIQNTPIDHDLNKEKGEKILGVNKSKYNILQIEERLVNNTKNQPKSINNLLAQIPKLEKVKSDKINNVDVFIDKNIRNNSKKPIFFEEQKEKSDINTINNKENKISTKKTSNTPLNIKRQLKSKLPLLKDRDIDKQQKLLAVIKVPVKNWNKHTNESQKVPQKSSIERKKCKQGPPLIKNLTDDPVKQVSNNSKTKPIKTEKSASTLYLDAHDRYLDNLIKENNNMKDQNVKNEMDNCLDYDNKELQEKYKTIVLNENLGTPVEIEDYSLSDHDFNKEKHHPSNTFYEEMVGNYAEPELSSLNVVYDRNKHKQYLSNKLFRLIDNMKKKDKIKHPNTTTNTKKGANNYYSKEFTGTTDENEKVVLAPILILQHNSDNEDKSSEPKNINFEEIHIKSNVIEGFAKDDNSMSLNLTKNTDSNECIPTNELNDPPLTVVKNKDKMYNDIFENKPIIEENTNTLYNDQTIVHDINSEKLKNQIDMKNSNDNDFLFFNELNNPHLTDQNNENEKNGNKVEDKPIIEETTNTLYNDQTIVHDINNEILKNQNDTKNTNDNECLPLNKLNNPHLTGQDIKNEKNGNTVEDKPMLEITTNTLNNDQTLKGHIHNEELNSQNETKNTDNNEFLISNELNDPLLTDKNNENEMNDNIVEDKLMLEETTNTVNNDQASASHINIGNLDSQNDIKNESTKNENIKKSLFEDLLRYFKKYEIPINTTTTDTTENNFDTDEIEISINEIKSLETDENNKFGKINNQRKFDKNKHDVGKEQTINKLERKQEMPNEVNEEILSKIHDHSLAIAENGKNKQNVCDLQEKAFINASNHQSDISEKNDKHYSSIEESNKRLEKLSTTFNKLRKQLKLKGNKSDKFINPSKAYIPKQTELIEDYSKKLKQIKNKNDEAPVKISHPNKTNNKMKNSEIETQDTVSTKFDQTSKIESLIKMHKERFKKNESPINIAEVKRLFPNLKVKDLIKLWEEIIHNHNESMKKYDLSSRKSKFYK